MEESSTSEFIQIGEQVVRINREQAIEHYSHLTSWADICECAPCRNFRPQRRTAFPSSFLSLLATLGIDPCKESEVYGCYPMPSGLRQYGGWFFFCGQLVSDTKSEVTQDGVTYFVRGPGNMPGSGGMFEPDPLALEFTIEIPWVLTDEDPDELYGPAIGNRTTGATK